MRSRAATLCLPLAALLAGLVAAAVVVEAPLAPLLTRDVAGSPARPPLPGDLSDVPLAAPAAAPAGEGGYAVLATDAGAPVRWDPCRPIRYVVDARTAPPGADYLLGDALAEVQRLTGLVFVYEGVADEPVTEGREPIQPDRYGQRWAPVLVAWSDPEAAPRLAGDVAGYAGPQPVSGAAPGSRRYVTGRLVLDGPQLAEIAAGPAGLARARAVVLHEVAHLVGLDHVEDRGQLMYPSTMPLVVDFSEGDRRGLAAVAGGPCHRDF